MSCDKRRSKMTAHAAAEQIDPGRGFEGGENERRKGEAGGVCHYSITIRAVLDFSTFQNKETNSSQSLSGPDRKNHIIFSRQPRSHLPLPAPYFCFVFSI